MGAEIMGAEAWVACGEEGARYLQLRSGLIKLEEGSIPMF